MDFVGIGGNPELRDATDGQLFALMAQRGSESKKAWEVFYCRYVNDLYRSVQRLRGLTPAAAKELVQETVIQAWRAAHTFLADETLDEDASRVRTLAWLGRIAQNIHLQMCRKPKVEFVSGPEQGNEENEVSAESTGRPLIPPGRLNYEIKAAVDQIAGEKQTDDGIPSNAMRTLLDALATLPEREREILLTTYEYNLPGEKQHLPKAVVSEMCQKYKISQTNLRKIRQRANEQVRQYLESHPTE